MTTRVLIGDPKNPAVRLLIFRETDGVLDVIKDAARASYGSMTGLTERLLQLRNSDAERVFLVTENPGDPDGTTIVVDSSLKITCGPSGEAGEGWNAYLQGLGISDNPYTHAYRGENIPKADRWQTGYELARGHYSRT